MEGTTAAEVGGAAGDVQIKGIKESGQPPSGSEPLEMPATPLPIARELDWMRNRSLTKEEVEVFWRQQGKPAPVDVGGQAVDDVASPFASPGRTMEKSPLGSSKQRSGSPVAPGHEDIDTGDADADADAAGKSQDWWTRSNWAFLNEPPQEVAPGTAHSYTPQFHVAAAGRFVTEKA